MFKRPLQEMLVLGKSLHSLFNNFSINQTGGNIGSSSCQYLGYRGPVIVCHKNNTFYKFKAGTCLDSRQFMFQQLASCFPNLCNRNEEKFSCYFHLQCGLGGTKRPGESNRSTLWPLGRIVCTNDQPNLRLFRLSFGPQDQTWKLLAGSHLIG